MSAMRPRKPRSPRNERRTRSNRKDLPSTAISTRLAAVVRELRALDKALASLEGLPHAVRTRRVLARVGGQLSPPVATIKTATIGAPGFGKKPSPRKPSANSAKRRPVAEAVVAVEVEVEEDEDEVEVDDEDEDESDAVAADTRWRVYVLKRVGGTTSISIDALQVCERIDDGVDPDDPDYRVWLLGLMDESPWWMHPASLEDNCIRLDFPADEYSGLPPFLDVERPRVPRVSSPWRLMAPNRGAIATFECTSVTDEDHRMLRQREALLRDPPARG